METMVLTVACVPSGRAYTNLNERHNELGSHRGFNARQVTVEYSFTHEKSIHRAGWYGCLHARRETEFAGGHRTSSNLFGCRRWREDGRQSNISPAGRKRLLSRYAWVLG